MRRAVLLSVLAVVLLPAVSLAQQGTAEIRGKVTDQQGAVVPGAAVTVRNQDTGMFREAVSTAEGAYFVTGVVPGSYEVTIALDGFKKYQRRDLLLEIGKTMTLDVQLELGSMQESITVIGESPIVDVTSKEVGGNITSRELTDLPSINRNYIGFVGLLPGIVPNVSTESFGSDSVNVNGQDDRNNNYLLDGANNNDDVIGQRAGTQARTALESIQEFQVITNQFDAEFGRTMGAVINAVTKQGTNVFRGSAFGFFQDARLTEKSYFVARDPNLVKPSTKQQQWGGTVGGPVIRDKAHFFFSLERVAIDRDNNVVIPTRPDLNYAATTTDRVWNTLLRFDHQLSANHTWGVRWLRERSPQRNQIIGTVTPAAAREESDTDQTVVTTLNSVLSNTRVNTVRLAFTREDVSFANPGFNSNGQRQDLLPPTLTFQSFTDQQSSVAQARINNALQFENTFSWFKPGWRGDHDIKLGFQYQYSSNDSVAQDNLNGTFTFGRNDLPFDPANPRTYPDRFTIRVPGALHNYTIAHFVAGFAQDKWKLSNRLTLSMGLRYDLEIMPVREVDNPNFSDPSQYPVDKNNVAPRIGFSWDPTGAGRMVLRGGYGLFYDKTHFELIGGIFTAGVFADSFTVTYPASNADPGPRSGQFPTDPFLVNGPTVNRDLLNQLYPAGSRQKNRGTVVWDNPNRRVPYSHEFTIGVQRQLTSNLAVTADYVRGMSRDLLMTKDLNPGLRDTTAVTSTLRRINPDFVQAVNFPTNVGRTGFDALELQVEKRLSHGYTTRVSYTLSYARGNTTGAGNPASGFQVLDNMHLELNEGPTNFDRRHNFVVSGSLLVPKTHGMTVSWVARALSGLPFTLTDGNVDLDRNGTVAEPLAAGSYEGTATGIYKAQQVQFESKRNGGRGPGFFQVDARFGWRLRLAERRSLDLFADVFNVTNRANFANPTGNKADPNFLLLTALRAGASPRTAQLAVRLGF
jgi:FlaG/FlaF family flagellin (archaellin)